MPIERITNLSGAPVVGQRYLVPTTTHHWIGAVSMLPVFLPRHNDAEILGFVDQHFHVDPRFLGQRLWQRAQDYAGGFLDPDNSALATCQRYPVSRLRNHDADPPQVIWRRLKCQRSEAEYVHGDKPNIVKLGNAYAGRPCKRARSGWVCPHQHFPMGSVPVVDGVQTCPLHGLRVGADDGVILAHGEPHPSTGKAKS